MSVGPSAELLKASEENPGAQFEILFPGDPGYGERGGNRGVAAFTVESRPEDHHLCRGCGGPFWVAYTNPTGESGPRHNVAVACPCCGMDVAVPLPSGVRDRVVSTRAADAW